MRFLDDIVFVLNDETSYSCTPILILFEWLLVFRLQNYTFFLILPNILPFFLKTHYLYFTLRSVQLSTYISDLLITFITTCHRDSYMQK